MAIITKSDFGGTGGGTGVFDPVQDITALKSIDTTDAGDYPDKWTILVEDQENWYRLDRDSAVSESLPEIVAPTTGVGRWIKVPGDEEVALTDLEDQSALSVVANATNSTAKPTAVQATTAERFFGRNASNILGFFQVATGYIVDLAITTAKIAANAVDFSKFVQSTGNTVVGKIGVGSGNYVHTPIINIYDGLPIVSNSRAVTANVTIDNGDHTVLLDGSSNTVTVTLPDPATVENQEFVLKAIDVTNACTVDPDTYEVDGSTTDISLASQWDWIRVKAVQLTSSPTYGYIKIGGSV